MKAYQFESVKGKHGCSVLTLTTRSNLSETDQKGERAHPAHYYCHLFESSL